MKLTLRGRRSLTVVLAVAALTSCSSGGHTTSTQPSTSAGPSVQPTSASSPEGRRLIAAAITATGALRSYSFSSVQDVGATKPTRTTITGTAIRPAALSYLLIAAGKRTQVIRIAGATYARVLPGSWSKAKKPPATVDPVASLLGLLRGVTQPTIEAENVTNATVRGVILTASAVKAGLPAGSKDSAVVITLDRNHRVVSVSIRTTVIRGGVKPITVVVRATYGMFNAVRPIKAPA